MRCLIPALVAVFLCQPASAQTCVSPQSVLTIWASKVPEMRVVTYSGTDAEKIVKTYNEIEPLSSHLADSFYAAASPLVEGVGMIFAHDGCVVVTETAPMSAFSALIAKALGRGL